ncbi:Galactose oxidase/kelch, beta-propeller [Cordyceps javanica]|uniref:Galactose oxidase/kelch, beta-propeller n=1 Tax=Cordyceps javanica TaxID=43265 RepID=A0A545WDJ2_9HYPO|nr:Galactose oxidase/kelch, beta-propeller [Cordyceps javanica]TQW12022.1 Galactose oxidase/kelch, beta-propeller [Cordyceps javanica]
MQKLLLRALFVPFGLAYAQFGDWTHGQINTSICTWSQPRAALVRDKIYIDGGSIWWTSGLENGTFGPIANKGNFQGIILSYDLSTPFNRDTNVTGILLDGSLSKARGGKGNANGDAPVYYDGALLANDAEFFLYGGAVFQANDLYDPPPAYDTLRYQAYPYGPDKPLWKPGFESRRLPDGTTRYIAYGGAASSPSENKAWYFSGLTTPSRGPFFWNVAASPDEKASVPSNTLITLDMESQLSEKWTNSTLPDHIKARANPEVVWVPIGEQGILVVLGGVTYPEWAGDVHLSPNETLSEKESPEFMSTIDIYDIASNTWHQQPTKDGPGTRTRGCAVVAAAADRSSFNIYYYGGFDGIHLSDEFYDDVWVLSLPSFTWTKISDGKPSHARAGHKCFLPYPDQMMVVGGYTPLAGTTLKCLEGGPIALLNITSGEWMDHYDPTAYGPYGVHEKVQTTIGGNSAGHATVKSPVPSGWATPALRSTFATSYDFSKMKNHWPYEPQAKNKTDSPANPSPSGKGSEAVASWIAPVLGVVLGLVLLSGGLLAFCIWRRRVAARPGSDASSSNEAMSERLFYWVKGSPQRRPTVTSTQSCCAASDVECSPTQESIPATDDGSVSAASPVCHEMENTQIAELDDTSPPVELHGTGVTATDVAWRRAGFTPLITSFGSTRSVRSVTVESPVAPCSVSGGSSDGTPSTPRHPWRWVRRLSVISSVSFGTYQESNADSHNVIISPIGASSSPTVSSENNADDDSASGVSRLRLATKKTILDSSQMKPKLVTN